MKKYRIIAAVIVLGLGFGCTDLNEKVYDRINAEDYYQTEDEVLTGLTNVYLKLMYVIV